MIPVAFAYGGWQTATFVAGEMRDPRRDLSRGLVAGVIGVVALYLAVNVVCLRVLGPRRAGRDHDAGIGGDARWRWASAARGGSRSGSRSPRWDF